MSPDDNQRVAFITGGSGGIGRAVVERLARDGMLVAVHYAGNESKAEDAVAAVNAAGGRAIAVPGDIADEVAMTSAFDVVERAFGGVDVVVNTAGVMRLSSVAEMDLEILDQMHRTNIRGTFVVSQQAARRLRSGGAIINFSSTVTKLAIPGYAAYAASKGAVDAITLILAKELRGRDITVNAIAPGPTATPLYFEGKDEAAIQAAAKASPLERLGLPDDIAEVVASLAGGARWVNGQILYVNGGVI